MLNLEIKILNNNIAKTCLSRLQSVSTVSPAVELSGCPAAASTNNTSNASRANNAKPFSEIPSPKGLPFIGNTHQMMSAENKKYSHKYFGGLQNQFGDIFKLKLMSEELVFICSPEDSRTLYSKDGMIPYLPGFEKFEEIRTKSLSHIYPIPGLLAQGEPWRQFRSAVQQDMMRPRSALYYVKELNETATTLCDLLEDSLDENRDTSDLNLNLQKFALEASAIMFIGSKLGVLSNQEDKEGARLMEAVSKLISKLQLLLNLPMWVLKISGNYKELKEIMSTTHEVCNKKIQEAIQRDKLDNSLQGTVLGKLIDRCGKDSPIPTIMAVDAMSAGIDTTAHTATFLLYHLATNPDKQEMLYEEICKVVGKHGDMTEAKLAEMRFLKACQQESQRIAPIASGTARKTLEDMVLSGYHIPKNTTVIRVGILSSNNPKYYKEPDQFLPERWIRGCPHNKKVDPFANLPFGHGPRACIGQRFARLELFMIAFKLVQKYKIEYHHPPIEIDFTGLGHPDRDVKIRLLPRN